VPVENEHVDVICGQAAKRGMGRAGRAGEYQGSAGPKRQNSPTAGITGESHLTGDRESLFENEGQKS